MPKRLKDVRERLCAETQKQLMEIGYSAITVRSIARACGIGTGTFYNYYSSKDILIADSMLGDWNQSLRAISDCAAAVTSPETVFACAYDQMINLSQKHRMLFNDESAVREYVQVATRYHGRLLDSLSDTLKSVCAQAKVPDTDFLAYFVAEALIRWAPLEKSFAELSPILMKCFE